jgi:hypothetical protein
MLLNKGKAGDKQILSEAAVEEMRKVQIAATQTKVVPKVDEGFAYALGSWTTENATAAGSKATVLVLPGLSGTWPLINYTKGYVFLVFAREFSGEQNAAVYTDLKKLIDAQFPVKNR